MAVYLIHFDQPLQHARHYVGFANDVDGRLWNHRHNKGANILKVLNRLGIKYDIVRVWDDADRTFERHLKNCKHTPRYCPVCNPHPAKYTPKEKTPDDKSPDQPQPVH